MGGLRYIEPEPLDVYENPADPKKSTRFWLDYMRVAVGLFGPYAKQIGITGDEADSITDSVLTLRFIQETLAAGAAPPASGFAARVTERQGLVERLGEIPEMNLELQRHLGTLLNVADGLRDTTLSALEAEIIPGVRVTKKGAVVTMEVDDEEDRDIAERAMKLISGDNVMYALITSLRSAMSGKVYERRDDGVHSTVTYDVDVFGSIDATAQAQLNRLVFGRSAKPDDK